MNITKCLNKMNNSASHNLRILAKEFITLDYKDDTNQSILHILVDDLYDEEKCLLAIKTLLSNGFNQKKQFKD